MTRPIMRALARAAFALASGAVPLAAAQAQAAEPPAYSALAMHRLADGSETSGRVTKSGPDMRLEYTEAGRQVIQIIRRAEGVMLMLDPATTSYVELRGAPTADPTGSGYLPPCPENDPSLDCRFVGTEVVSGITAEAWEIARPGQPGTSRILWDGARHKALAQTFPDGSESRMSFVGMQNISGRQAEHWTVTMTAPGRDPSEGAWFYDPELRVEVREESPDGEARWLDEITVGPVDARLFVAPEGWTKVVMPDQPPFAPN